MYKKLNGNTIIIKKLLIASSKLFLPIAVTSNAVAVITIPHISLCELAGSSFPLSLSIPKTKTAESIELIIEINTKKMATKKVTSKKRKML